MALLVGSMLDRACATSASKVAVTLGEQAYTFAEVNDRSWRTANAFAALDVGRGSVVAWWTGMSLRNIEGFVATARLGGAFAPLNPHISAGEAEPLVEYLQPRILVADGERAEAAAEVAQKLEVPLAVVGTQPGVVPGLHLDELTDAASSLAPAVPKPREDDTHAIFLTSGSTGVPKGVMLSHRASWLRSFPGGSGGGTAYAGPGGIVSMFPLFHWAGWQFVMQAWQSVRPIHLVHRAEAETLLDTVVRWQAVLLYCIPAVWNRVFEHRRGKMDVSSLRHANTGTSLVDADLLHAIKDRFPASTTTVSYGSTEGGKSTELPDWDLFSKPGSVGLPASPVTVRLSDDGEICVRSPALMTGYYRRPEETADVLREGWYHTGDLGSFDSDGYLSITGRQREVIRSGAETIAPAEVESALAGIAGVVDVAVVGLPDAKWGEVVCAVFVLADGVPCPTVDQLRRHLDGTLARYKHPRQVVSVETIPRTPATGQVRRTALRDVIVATR